MTSYDPGEPADSIESNDPRYAVPAAFRPGLLPRKTQYGNLRVEGRYVPVFREALPTIARTDWTDLLADPNKPSLAGCVWNVYDQDGVGSCASESCYKGMETLREILGRKRVQFNPWFAYHTVSDGRDQGSSLDDNVAFLMEKGACPEAVWPRSKGWKAAPTDEAYDAANQYRLTEVFDLSTSRTQYELEVGSALLQGMAVYFGYPGHAILGVELVDPKTVKYINSWGDWGDNGFGTIKLASLQPSYGAFAFRNVTEPTT